jgi:phage gpG-like protein
VIVALVEITLDVAGDKQLARAFEATAREVEDMSDPLARFGEHLLREIGEQFQTEGARGGEPWRRLTRAYETWKEEHYPGRPILVQSSAMRSAALSPRAVTITPRRLVYEIDDANVCGGTRSEHDRVDRGQLAYWHQVGAGRLPARPIVQLNQEARRELDRIFASWLTTIRRHHLPL